MRRRLPWTPPRHGASPPAVAAERAPARDEPPSAPSAHASAPQSTPVDDASLGAPSDAGRFASPQALETALRRAAYVADDALSTAAFLALALGKPLLLEGAPGVGNQFRRITRTPVGIHCRHRGTAAGLDSSDDLAH